MTLEASTNTGAEVSLYVALDVAAPDTRGSRRGRAVPSGGAHSAGTAMEIESNGHIPTRIDTIRLPGTPPFGSSPKGSGFRGGSHNCAGESAETRVSYNRP